MSYDIGSPRSLSSQGTMTNTVLTMTNTHRLSMFSILAGQVKTVISAQVSGVAWMTTDAGGYCGGDSQSPAYRETQVRER